MSVVCFFFLFIFSICWFFLVVFFFFKQKTAYEMRISDWSSDVCSSDLFFGPFGFNFLNALSDGFLRRLGFFNLSQTLCILLSQFFNEIGRASCRERVCQYV